MLLSGFDVQDEIIESECIGCRHGYPVQPGSYTGGVDLTSPPFRTTSGER